MSATRRTEGLDPMPSTARLREMYRERTGRELDDLAHDVLDLTVADRKARRMLNNAVAIAREELRRNGPWEPVTVGDALTAKRLGDSLELTLRFAPRTKKGHTTLGIRQSPQYRKYRDDIKAVIAAVHGKLGLPLPPRPQTYNLCAVYYVDRYGKTADLFGLHDGLADALQNADVIENDWQFRTADGSRIVCDDPEPRVEITITRSA